MVRFEKTFLYVHGIKALFFLSFYSFMGIWFYPRNKKFAYLLAITKFLTRIFASAKKESPDITSGLTSIIECFSSFEFYVVIYF